MEGLTGLRASVALEERESFLTLVTPEGAEEAQSSMISLEGTLTRRNPSRR
jgi:hypothetical protein